MKEALGVSKSQTYRYIAAVKTNTKSSHQLGRPSKFTSAERRALANECNRDPVRNVDEAMMDLLELKAVRDNSVEVKVFVPLTPYLILLSLTFTASC